MQEEYSNKWIACEGCEQEFLWKVGEQEFHSKMGFPEPKRCPSCRVSRELGLKMPREGVFA